MNQEDIKGICAFAESVRKPYKEKLQKLKKQALSLKRSNCRLSERVNEVEGQLEAAKEMIRALVRADKALANVDEELKNKIWEFCGEK